MNMSSSLSFSKDACSWLNEQLGIMTEIISIIPLKGGISTSLFEVRYMHETQLKKAVLRFYDNNDWLLEEPDLLNHEKCSLQTLMNQHDLPSPRFIAAEETGAVFGHPALLMSHLEGEMKLLSFEAFHFREMVKPMIKLHRHPAPDLPWRYKPYVDIKTVRVPKWTKVPELWARNDSVA